MKVYMNIAVAFLFALTCSTTMYAQDQGLRKGSLGFNFGMLSYSGRYAVDKSFTSHSSLYAAVAYRENLWESLFIRVEVLGSQLKGDNTDLPPSSIKTQGWFKTNIAEASIKAEYDFLYLSPNDLSPFIAAGVAAYTLFNYSASLGKDPKSNKNGFAVPVGGGVKYKVSNHLTLITEGNVRLFTKNIDNHKGENVNNPNLYYGFGFGISYEFIPSQKKKTK